MPPDVRHVASRASFHHGIGFTEGCNGFDVTCTVVYAPPLIGDAGEEYQAVFAEQYYGITPTGNSRMFLLYTPPTVYPVRLDAVDTAWRGGADPVRLRRLRGPRGHEPDAGRLRRHRLGGRRARVRDLPHPGLHDPVPGSAITSAASCPTTPVPGPWSARPTGTPALPSSRDRRRTAERPSRRGTTTSSPRSWRSAGPASRIEVRPETTVMDLGTTQIVDVIVAASGGEAGALERLTFEDAGVLALTGEDAALEIVDISEAAPGGWVLPGRRGAAGVLGRGARGGPGRGCRAGRDRWHG